MDDKIKVVFLTNFMNHHQLPFADEMHKHLGDGFIFVETTPMPESFVQNGYPEYKREYIIRSYINEGSQTEVFKLIDAADVVIIGSAPSKWVMKRKMQGKLTFHYAERWFRKGLLYALKPWTLWWIYNDHFRFRNKRTYMLCASAFTANDINELGLYKNKCFKWGYFPAVKDIDVTSLPKFSDIDNRCIRFMWCARFIELKHPEMAINLIAYLKNKNYQVDLDMYGIGPLIDDAFNLCHKLGVDDCVRIHGGKPNAEILKEMQSHDIFLFTSDKREGWGAVVNEAMSNGCVLVASDEIGSVPFLIQDGKTGYIFKSKDQNSLNKAVLSLINDRSRIIEAASAAYELIKNVWSPQNAANNLLSLMNDLLNYKNPSIKDGPASIATPYKAER